TKADAQAWVREQRQQWDARTWAAKSERTFDDVADHWLKVREADDSTRENTIRADRESLAYARRAFGSVAVQKLTPEVLVDWSLSMTTKAGKPLAASTKRRAIVTIKAVMAHALRMRWVSFDPTQHLDPPAQKVI